MQKWLINNKNTNQRHWLQLIVVPMPLALIICVLLLLTNTSIIMAQNFDYLREQMVDEQLRKRGIQSKSVLNAMQEVPRHEFVPANLQNAAYRDGPLPIGLNQTISQPYIVAFMTDQIDPYKGMRVLEIGTGSGYQAAILAHLGCKVYTIELLPELAERATETLKRLDYSNVKVMCGNGYLGWPEHAPFDAIMVTAAPEEIPPILVEQLKDGGVMILPVGPVNSMQYLKKVHKKGDKISTTNLIPVRFVPMIDK